MKCPNCTDSKLLIMKRQEIEIDYCPECSGLWLEKEDLELILKKEKSTQNVVTFKRKKIYDVIYRHEFYQKKRTISS